MLDVSANESDALDEGLSRLAATGPEYRVGLSNHGPMAAEALVRLGRADALAGWLDGYLRRPDPLGDLRTLAGEFARVFLGYGRRQPITFLHAVTAPVAAYSVLPLLPSRLARPTYDALWHVGAALYAVHAGGVTPEPLPSAPPLAREDLTDRAVATRDEHAIKLTEACLRLHAETTDPLLLHAAARATALLGRH